jgi:hypothetical protein
MSFFNLGLELLFPLFHSITLKAIFDLEGGNEMFWWFVFSELNVQ